MANQSFLGRLLLPVVFCGSVLVGRPALGAGDSAQLLDMSIEDLLAMEVTSVSRKKQSVAQSAAAVFVITQEDIRRTGARSIPEALRMAPGLQVAQLDANKWAISARGFNGRFANKLLVLMDGRTLYTPAFSGVFWDVQDTMMEDIERIEVIRGPGGTLWGTNAVNGVINIITRNARNTQGGLATASYSDQESAGGALRFGGAGGEDVAYRTYLKYQNMGENEDTLGQDANDDWRQLRAGARVDWSPGDDQELTLLAEGYSGKSGDTLQLGTLTPPYLAFVNEDEDVSGAFVLGRWSHTWAPGRETAFQAYFDKVRRDTYIYGEDHDTIDLELQHRFAVGARHDIVAGLGYRHNEFDFMQTPYITVVPASPSDDQVSVFVQDEITLLPDRLWLTLGSKFEHNDLSDKTWEIMPNLRVSWAVDDTNHLWGAVTRSARTPSYADLGASITGLGGNAVIPPGTPVNPLPLPIQVQITGNPAQQSEDLLAYELGYRAQPIEQLGVDVTLFLHEYEDLRGTVATGLYCDSTGEMVTLPVLPACIFTSTSLLNRFSFDNSMEVETKGVELAVDWRPADKLRVAAAYTYLYVDQESTLNAYEERVADSNPKHQLSLRGDLQIGSRVDLGMWLRYTDELANSIVDDYWSADVRLGWRLREDLELSLTGSNLLESSHLEYVSELGDLVPTEIERALTASLRWSF